MNHVLNFYDTKINIIFPSSFTNFKQLVSEALSLNPSEVEELTFSYINPSTKVKAFIFNDVDYNNFILFSKQNSIEISIAINESSSIIKQEEVNINNEIVQTQIAKSNNNSIKKVPLPKDIKIHNEYECSICSSNLTDTIYLCLICKLNYCEQCENVHVKEHDHPLLKAYLSKHRYHIQQYKIMVNKFPVFKK